MLQFGPTSELPRIKLQKAYSEGLGELPDWRITAFLSGGRIVIAASPMLRSMAHSD